MNAATGTITVSADGVKLQYIDSGPPSKPQYRTVFAIHGMCFAAPIFQKTQAAAFARGIRLVAITRRHFPGSTPYTTEEMASVKEAPDDAKTKWLDARGVEISAFIINFMKDNNLPELSKDGTSGGIAIFGWSLGTPFAIAAISSAQGLPEDRRALLEKNLCALVMHEPSPIALGLPSPAKNWTHLTIQTIPFPERFKGFAQWMTAYFDHADVYSRDDDKLTWCVPSSERLPSIFNMDPAFVKEHLLLDDKATFDLVFLVNLAKPMLKSHQTVFFDSLTRKSFPFMKISLLSGDRAPGWGPFAVWNVQNEEKQMGKEGDVICRFIKGGNHFLLWDEPESMVDEIEKCMAA